MVPNAEQDDCNQHVLDFFFDDEDDCALTVSVGDLRFHIIADHEKLRCETAKSPGQQYRHLLQQVRSAENHSGNDVSATNGAQHKDTRNKKSNRETPERSIEDPESALQDWMISAAESVIKSKACTSRKTGKMTLREWYDLDTCFISLETTPDLSEVEAIELEATSELIERMANLEPRLSLPKYILELKIPHYNASDVWVDSYSSLPLPYRPSHVRLRGQRGSSESLYIKLVDPANPSPTKREIKLLHAIAQKGLHSKIQCPEIKGLVLNNSSGRATLLGFLQTAIPAHTPLTTKLDCSIATQDQRERWAKEVERIKEVLHENRLVWGDAKADNFLVEEKGDDNEETVGRLWIIDFGGSFTEGWVDENIQETEEGDEMGVEKTANALRDPEENTFEPEDETKAKKTAKVGMKRPLSSAAPDENRHKK